MMRGRFFPHVWRHHFCVKLRKQQSWNLLEMTTRLQTVEVHLPRLPFPLYSIEEAPVAPLQGCVKVLSPALETVWTGETIEQRLQDGTFKIWRPRPSLQGAIVPSYVSKNGVFVQFYADGSTVMRDQQTFYWGPEKPGEPLEGAIVRSHTCFDGEVVFDDESDCVCETRLPKGSESSNIDYSMLRYSFWT